MKSSIKIDFDGALGNVHPVIRVSLEDSEDVRDGLMKFFFEKLGHQSSWLTVAFNHHIINGEKDSKTYITISPVTPEDLAETIRLIKDRLQSTTANFTPFLPEPNLNIGNPAKNFQVISIERDGNSDKDGTPMHYKLVVTKSLKGLREGILREAIENVINDPSNYINQ